MSLRIAYLGTSDFAAELLRRLAESKHRPALVVTPPDRPQGRGRKLAPPPAAVAAEELGIELFQAESVNDEGSLARLRSAGLDLAVVCAFGQLIKQPLLGELTMLNVHPSLLPRWRGAAPIERAIMAGDRATGVTIMRLTEGLDSGPVALQEQVEIGEDEDFGALSARLVDLSTGLLLRVLDQHEAGELSFAEQDESLVTYAEKIAPEERRLDPTRPAVELANRVRAFARHVGTYLESEDGTRLGVTAARVGEADLVAGVLRAEDVPVLGCGVGSLRLETVQPPGKTPMSGADFLRGHSLPDCVK